MNDGTLPVDDGVQSNRRRQLVEKLSLLLEFHAGGPDEMGPWLRDNALHSEHLIVWVHEVRDAMGKGEQDLREELRAVKKKIREQERELVCKERALAEMAIIVAAKKRTACSRIDRTISTARYELGVVRNY